MNVCNEEGRSLLTCFVQGYFEFRENSFEQSGTSADEEAYLTAEEYELLKTPLEKRGSGIKAQLDFLFENGADPNLCVMVDGRAETALMQAVIFCDYYMAKYLLEHGADPKVRLFSENELPKTDMEYWLLDDLDIRIMNHADEKESEIAADIAQLLWEYGLRRWSGFCIDMDDEKGVSGVHGIIVKY